MIYLVPSFCCDSLLQHQHMNFYDSVGRCSYLVKRLSKEMGNSTACNCQRKSLYPQNHFYFQLVFHSSLIPEKHEIILYLVNYS